MPDTERLARFAQDAFDGCTEVRLTYHTVKKLAKTLREANFKVQITGTLTDGVLTIMDVSEKEDAPLYGCAIDIGTTTVTGRAHGSEDRHADGESLCRQRPDPLRCGCHQPHRRAGQARAGVKRLQGRDLEGNAAAARRGNVQIGGVPVSRVFRV